MPTPGSSTPFAPFTPVSERRQKTAVRETRKAFPATFPSDAVAHNFLFQIVLPPSRRWSFISVGKSASTSTLHALYGAEFGHPLTANMTPLHDINPNAAIHTLPDHGVFARALWQGLSILDVLGIGAERICVVRDPLARALSGFRYLCRSHRQKARWFARERFLMDAAVGFDWDTHPDTPAGFERFLQFIAWQVADSGVDSLNGHWRPQAAFIKPAAFRPTLIGRMERMDQYYDALNARLSPTPPITHLWKNRQDADGTDALLSPASLRLCTALFAQDYQLFEYALPDLDMLE
jgi:hypothetical protein